jgi:serine/threonine protein kinase
MKETLLSKKSFIQAVLVFLLTVAVFIPAHAAFSGVLAEDDELHHDTGMGHNGNGSYGMQGMMAGFGSGSLTLPIIYGLFAVVIILVALVLYIVLVKNKTDKKENPDNERLPPYNKQKKTDSMSRSDYGFPKELYEKYSDVSLIKRGGTSSVYSAKPKAGGSTVALKIPAQRDEKSGKIFLQETGIWEKLKHKNIVELKSVNVFPVPYAETEFVGDSLDTLQNPLDRDIALIITSGILNGLSYAHKKGVVHCDIKPGNILIDDSFTPKITDWGTGRYTGADGNYEGIKGYTPAFAAPEQLLPEGRCTEKTDIYQTGLLMIWMICGRDVFEKRAGEIRGGFVPDCINDEKLKKIISGCTRKDPQDRYKSSGELLSLITSLSVRTVVE